MQLLPFVKLFALNDGHILIRKNWNAEEETHELIISFCILDGPDIDMALKFSTKETRDKKFDEFTDELAQKFVEKFDSHFKENPPTEQKLDLYSKEEPVINPTPLIVVASSEAGRLIIEHLNK